ncbi:MAG: rhomboid family intramembrane serine protease [Victivallales bacterium]|nr:rhomboid family intramembrane serine protease [Victivallales bacterium]
MQRHQVASACVASEEHWEPLPEDDATFWPPDPVQLKPWMAVLAARKLPFHTAWRRGRQALVLSLEHAPAAAREIAAWQRANEAWPPPQENPRSKAPLVTDSSATAAAAVVAALSALHIRVSQSPEFWYRPGAWDGARVRAGEWWRLITCLTLHADQAHLFANVAWLAALLALLGAELGAGVTVFAMLATGLLGSLAMTGLGAWHQSIGASTMVFGLIGVLCTVRTWDGVQRRLRTHCTFAQILPWIPLLAGAANFALYGTSPGSDVLAHVCGLLAGIPVGLATIPLRRHASRFWLQTLLALLAAATVLLAWHSAFHIAP